MNQTEGKTKVIIFTANYRIFGQIAHFSDTRLTDYMIESKSFVAVTSAQIQNYEGKKIMTTSFLNVQRNQIEIILPADSAD